jgi:crossover junction endodeoxyribonuclease RuvC
MTYVLGLDTSTKTGYCVLSTATKEVVELGEQSFKATGVARFHQFYDWASELCLKYRPDAILIEGYGFGNQHTLVTLVEVGTAIRLALFSKGAKMYTVPPTVLKKFVTGAGNAKKDQMALGIYKRWGLEFPNNNEADAYALARMALAMVTEEHLTKDQQACLTKVTRCT